MQYPKYPVLNTSPDNTVFSFVSTGPNGDFVIEVQFTPINGTILFNLGFGVKSENGEIDDIIAINNGDRDKILATVAGFVKDFGQTYPYTVIFFSGSTLARTRLYRRAISINYNQLKNDFEILGLPFGSSFEAENFSPTGNYEAFLIRRITFGS